MGCSRTLWHTRTNERYAQWVEPTMSYYDYSNAEIRTNPTLSTTIHVVIVHNNIYGLCNNMKIIIKKNMIKKTRTILERLSRNC